jgi:organic radical activating enzyme
MNHTEEKTIRQTQLKLGTALPVMESFYTIQGEGFHQGKAAYFIRLGGCDVGCVWCDVKESWPMDAHPVEDVEQIAKKAADSGAQMVVITGGEPLMHDLGPLTQALKKFNLTINIETSGAHPMSGRLDWVCLSPKKFKAPLPEIFPYAHELKIVVYNKSDFQWGEDFAAKMKPGCRLFLQPEWSKASKMLPLIINYVKKHPQWQISLQTHKYMDIP